MLRLELMNYHQLPGNSALGIDNIVLHIHKILVKKFGWVLSLIEQRVKVGPDVVIDPLEKTHYYYLQFNSIYV